MKPSVYLSLFDLDTVPEVEFTRVKSMSFFKVLDQGGRFLSKNRHL